MMLKLTSALLALVVAGTASAGWRSLRIDSSSEASFKESVALLQDKLTPGRRETFDRSLLDILAESKRLAEAQLRAHTQDEFRRKLDGLGYEQVVTLLDPTGETAKRYRAAHSPRRGAGWSGMATASSPWNYGTGGPPPVEGGVYRGATRSIDRQMH